MHSIIPFTVRWHFSSRVLIQLVKPWVTSLLNRKSISCLRISLYAIVLTNYSSCMFFCNNPSIHYGNEGNKWSDSFLLFATLLSSVDYKLILSSWTQCDISDRTTISIRFTRWISSLTKKNDGQNLGKEIASRLEIRRSLIENIDCLSSCHLMDRRILKIFTYFFFSLSIFIGWLVQSIVREERTTGLVIRIIFFLFPLFSGKFISPSSSSSLSTEMSSEQFVSEIIL